MPECQDGFHCRLCGFTLYAGGVQEDLVQVSCGGCMLAFMLQIPQTFRLVPLHGSSELSYPGTQPF